MERQNSTALLADTCYYPASTNNGFKIPLLGEALPFIREYTQVYMAAVGRFSYAD